LLSVFLRVIFGSPKTLPGPWPPELLPQLRFRAAEIHQFTRTSTMKRHLITAVIAAVVVIGLAYAGVVKKAEDKFK
jgi:hypothetical protein